MHAFNSQNKETALLPSGIILLSIMLSFYSVMCLSIMLSKKDIRCLKADIDVGTTKCVGLLVKATDVSR